MNDTNSTFHYSAPGAIHTTGTLTLKNSTIANSGGFGIEAYGNYTTGSNTSTLSIENTILANNGDNGNSDCNNQGALILAFIHNLVRRGNCGTPTVSADPKLGALADNGGPTQTMSLLPGSPAIDAGDDATCETADQRGITRPQGPHCDIGAFEITGPVEYTLTINKVGNGTVTPDKVAPYHLNDVVQLTQVADTGWTFSAWSGACTGSGACSITMDANKSVTATFTQNAQVTHTVADFNGDGASDIGIFRPSETAWYIQGMPGVTWGAADDILVPGDYNGDGTSEIAVFHPADGKWYINGQEPIGWGQAGDIPVPGDYDGDGKTDIAVYRPSEGAWYIMGQPTFTIWGVPGDIPVPGDYDGDGKTDLAVYQPGEYSLWWIKGQPSYKMWGNAEEKPIPADYNGDGKTEIAVDELGQ